MKKLVLLLLLAMPVAIMAQVNEMFYVPKKQVKQENVAKMFSSSASATENDEEWGVADNGNTRDVDEYNRRGSATVSADNVEALLQQESVEEYDEYVYEDDTDYNYSTRIVRFHNPTTVIVSSPWYYDVYPSWGYYDYCYDDYWDWSIGWNSLCGWSIGAAWHWPLHSWHWGSGHHHHHHPHHVAPPVYSHRVQRRVPTVSLADRGRTGRVPVAGAATEKRPNTQVVNGKVDRTNRENVGGARLRDDRNRGGSSSTYNRRSSTSVRKENAGNRNNRTEVSGGGNRNNRGSGSGRSSVRSNSGGGSRSSVGAASRGSSSSRGSAPTRGGVSRGGRR